MSLFIQHGYGKADRIDTSFASESTQGVIFAARNEKPDKLESYIEKLKTEYPWSTLLLDPQFYLSAVPSANDKYLPEYAYFEQSLSHADFSKPRKVKKYVKKTLEYQNDLELDYLISPTVLFQSFSDRWSQVSLNLAEASIEFSPGIKSDIPLLVSFCMNESALYQKDDIDHFLDAITQVEWEATTGFYFLIDRNEKKYNQQMDKEVLLNLLYITHVLTEINGFEVFFGYSDFIGLPLLAAGATSIATGWNQSIRQFNIEKMKHQVGKQGGSAPRLRYSSAPLLNSILLGDLVDTHDMGYGENFMSDVDLDNQLLTVSGAFDDSKWVQKTEQLHHWETLNSLISEFSGDAEEDVDLLLNKIQTAKNNYVLLKRAGKTFEKFMDSSHLNSWKLALEEFKDTIL